MTTVITTVGVVFSKDFEKVWDGRIIFKAGFVPCYTVPSNKTLGCKMFSNPMGDTVFTVKGSSISSSFKELKRYYTWISELEHTVGRFLSGLQVRVMLIHSEWHEMVHEEHTEKETAG